MIRTKAIILLPVLLCATAIQLITAAIAQPEIGIPATTQAAATQAAAQAAAQAAPVQAAAQVAAQAAPVKTPLATGNGYGFAVYSLSSYSVSKFYAHPYMFTKPDTKDPLAEGTETTNFVKSLVWQDEAFTDSVQKDLAQKESTQKEPDKFTPSQEATVSYLDESQVIQIDNSARSQWFFMPFGLEENVLITSAAPRKNNSEKSVLSIKWEHPVESDNIDSIDHTEVHVITFQGVDESILMIPLTESGHAADSTRSSTSEQFYGYSQWAIVSLDKKGDAHDEKLRRDLVSKIKQWQNSLGVPDLVNRELKEIDAWRVKPAVHFKSDQERKLWRQSEMILRMAQIREANTADRHNHGMILASLPDGAWFVPWVRDMAYATLALSQMGHQAEARSAIESYFNAQPTSKLEKEVGAPYQVSLCRYFGNGEEEPFFTMEGANNVEFDDWGLVLWVLGDYMRKYNDKSLLDYKTYRGSLYDNARDFVVKPLLHNIEAYKDGLIVGKDTSIWEERQKDAKHFAFSTIAAINGLKGFESIITEKRSGEKSDDSKLDDELKSKIPLLEKGFVAAYAPSHELRGVLEEGIKNEVDGASLASISSGIITERDTILKAVERMQRLKMPTGGYRRVTCILTDPAIFEYWYERQEFLFIDFLMAEVYQKLGAPDKAAALIDPLIKKAAEDHNFIPEMYVSEVNYRFKGPLGAPTGAIPMVGYGAGIYISYLLEREASGR